MIEILEQINIFFENRKIIEKLYKDIAGGILDEYNINEMHCIHFIGELEKPNVTKLAHSLKISKAAVSRIIKKLLKKEAIQTYSSDENKKEIYYRLTSLGEQIFAAHNKIHNRWCNDELNYLKSFTKDQLLSVLDFLKKYNKIIETGIKPRKKN